MIYVVGSGPAGVACAYALIRKGLKVTMLDAGIELEQVKSKILEKLQRSKKWDPKLLEKIKGNTKVTVKGVSRKLIYGSDYPYKEADTNIKLTAEGITANPSFAYGGLSNVWGAAVMPYRAEDIKDWPITLEQIAPYYTAVLEFMHIAVANIGNPKDFLAVKESKIPLRDYLQELFPIYARYCQDFNYSRQAFLMIKDLEVNKKKLNDAGIFFGSSRLVVQFEAGEKKPGCVYCGLCLHGCPYKLIYSSAFTVDKLRKNKNFRYQKDVIVEKINEKEDNVIILAHERNNKKRIIFKGSRVFLACGALTTTRIMLESMRAYNEEVILKDSQYYLFHLLRYKSAGNVTKEPLHTLAQMYIEIFDNEIDNNSVHLQLYTYSDLYDSALKSIFRVGYSLLKRPLVQIMSRLIIGQGYLHSNSSSTISVKLEKGYKKLYLRNNENKSSNRKIKDIMWKLFKNRRYIKAMPLIPLLKIGKPGESNHLGGSFPMRKNPKRFQTDVLGRPFGYKKVHLVDSSVFPSIPAQTITLTVMANAYRIADQYDKLK